MAMKEIFLVVDNGCKIPINFSHAVGMDLDIGDVDDDEDEEDYVQLISPILIFATADEAKIYRGVLLAEGDINLKGDLVICRGYISIRDKIS